MFKAAVRDGIIQSDPTDGVVLPRKRRNEAALMLPTSEQVGTLLEVAEDPFRPMLALAAFAGLGVGEICAVQLGDVELLGRRLQVRRQVQRENSGGVEIRAPKYSSERTIHLPDGLVQILARHVEARGLTRHGEWLFYGRDGNPPHQTTVTYYWRRARAKASVQELKMHDMRHHFASGSIAAGCDVVMVQRALGHATATTTLNIYADLWPTAEDRTRAAADRLLTGALGDPPDPLRTDGGQEVR
ncbi:site-specific integrase [Pseudonocardia kujensis]|uniref:tyrosine-type recombinase/integrase n=1 Tax=Pseudonocardia kujensis TaxID=1128675 RepID=UPI001E2E4646|nr:site-specific integrase [Pseudonocardia kujensis]MCE0765278.1 site-specific integrase [Pseudonocardia kujensis]